MQRWGYCCITITHAAASSASEMFVLCGVEVDIAINLSERELNYYNSRSTLSLFIRAF